MAAAILVAVSGGIGFAAEAPPAGEPETSRVLARVNQVEITYGDLKGRLASLQHQGPIAPERRGEVLRAIVREEILVQGAIADRLDQDAAFKARMDQVRRQVLIEELLKRKVLDLIQVTEEETRKAYEDNKALLTTETVGVSHIMLKTQAEAEAIRQELVGGKDFAELAKANSQDTASAAKGGDLGTLGRGQTESEFEEAAFSLKEGELSPVVKTQYGYHIIKGGPHKGVTQPYEEVMDRIRQTLAQQKQRDAFLAYMENLEKGTKTEILEDRLR
jgi:parvulin-like peptidyl-prolyl isomerase